MAEKLTSLTKARDSDRNALSPEWMVRVFLSMPTVSARGVAQAHADLVGRGQQGCSRGSITRIRNAFVVMAMEMNSQELLTMAKQYLGGFLGPAAAAKAAATRRSRPGPAAGARTTGGHASAAAGARSAGGRALTAASARSTGGLASAAADARSPGGHALTAASARSTGGLARTSVDSPARAAEAARSKNTAACFVLLHVHDEARLRLRHKDSATGSPSKSRGSSAQGHVLSLRAGEAAPVEVHRHLGALEHKDAACIATSLERALRDTAKAVAGSVYPGLLRANGGFVENIFCPHPGRGRCFH